MTARREDDNAALAMLPLADIIAPLAAQWALDVHRRKLED